METNNLTGYPSIDKPWLKHYTEEEINTEIPKCSIYEKIYENNADYPDEIALMFYGKKITYREMFINIDNTAKAFVAMGIKNGDNVAVCMPALPESVYTILALNKIGANANLLNPLFDEQQLKNRINETEAKLIVVANELYGRVKNILSDTTVENIISCPAVNSMGAVVKIIKKAKTIAGTTGWNDFIRRGKLSEATVPEYQPNKPALMVYSSGTTGDSKGIQLTNDGILTLLVDARSVYLFAKRQDRYFIQIPIWFSTGLIATLFSALYYGMVAILEPEYNLPLFKEHIAKYRPNYLITANSLMEYLYETEYKHPSYTTLTDAAIGGEYLTPQAELRYNKWLKDNGNNYGVKKGYGMCELGSIVTAASVRFNTLGSTGIPTPHSIVSAFDLETGEELKYGQRGEIRVCSPCRMLGYYKNEEATRKFFHTDEKGNVWACTGDMGYITEDGDVFVDGRINDSYKNEKGETIYLFDIERAILSNENVRQCKVVASEIDGKQIHVAHINLVKGADINEVLPQIKAYCVENLLVNHIPELFKIHDSALPMALSGKMNTAEMRKDITDLITV